MSNIGQFTAGPGKRWEITNDDTLKINGAIFQSDQIEIILQGLLSSTTTNDGLNNGITAVNFSRDSINEETGLLLTYITWLNQKKLIHLTLETLDNLRILESTQKPTQKLTRVVEEYLAKPPENLLTQVPDSLPIETEDLFTQILVIRELLFRKQRKSITRECTLAVARMLDRYNGVDIVALMSCVVMWDGFTVSKVEELTRDFPDRLKKFVQPRKGLDNTRTYQPRNILEMLQELLSWLITLPRLKLHYDKYFDIGELMGPAKREYFSIFWLSLVGLSREQIQQALHTRSEQIPLLQNAENDDVQDAQIELVISKAEEKQRRAEEQKAPAQAVQKEKFVPGTTQTPANVKKVAVVEECELLWLEKMPYSPPQTRESVKRAANALASMSGSIINSGSESTSGSSSSMADTSKNSSSTTPTHGI